MELAEIARVTEHELRQVGDLDVFAHVSVTLEPDDDGSDWLDIRAHSPDHRLPTARQSLDFKLRLRERLAALGETRSPNLIFVTRAQAA